MFRSLVGKTLGDSMRGYPWWLGGLFAYVVLISLVYPFLEERGEALQELLENYPEALLAAFGIDPSLSIASVEGFLATYVFGWMVPLFFLVFAISYGARAIAGEEETGTMDLLLANPVRRSSVVLAKFAALGILLAGLSVALFAGVLVGGLIVGWELELGRLAAASLSGALLGLLFGGVTILIGSGTGRRAMTSGIATALAFAAYLLFTMGGLVDELATAVKLSPIWLYAGTETIVEGLAPAKASVMAIAGLIAGGLASFLFEHRDVRS